MGDIMKSTRITDPIEKSGKIKKILFVPALLIIMGICGYILLAVAYCLPTEPMARNLAASSAIFENEGTSARTMNADNSMLDNFTDALMLLTAAHPSGENPFIGAVNNERYEAEEGNTVEALVSIYGEGDTDYESIAYGRYWHGYLIFLKPLLTVLNYGRIRSVLMFVQLALFGALLIRFTRRKSGLILPLFAAYLFMNPSAMMLSIQYNTVLCLTFTAMLLILRFEERWKGDLYKWSLFFMIVGAATAYFDLLTYPLVALGMPLALWMAFNFSEKIVENLKNIFRLSLFWGIGYGGLWSFKWILGSLMTGESMIGDALGQIAERTGSSVSDAVVSYFDVLYEQLHSSFQITWVVILLAAATVFLYRLIKGKKVNWNLLLTMGVIGAMPLIWYFLLKNHSYIHHWFTFRELAISIFAGLTCMILHGGGRKHG